MLRNPLRLAVGLLIGGLLVVFSLPYGSARTSLLQPGFALASTAAGPTPLLNYQGRLLNPATGEPKSDGLYAMTFSLYNVEGGGTALWSETDNVDVKGGLFTTLLGDQVPLDGAVLNGQDLWLGVTVGTDPEATPRQRVAHAAYAFFANTAANANNADMAGYANNADTLDGNDSAAFAPAGHTHPGLAPIAYGFIWADGTKSAGTANVQSVWEAAPLNRYRISIDGEGYYYASYVTVVTPASVAPCLGAKAAVGSVDGKLLVYTLDPGTNAQIQCAFQFVVYKP